MPIELSKNSLLFQLGVALLYVISAFIGQAFAIPPGNITPVWLPSGLMFALTLKYGARTWLGIFVGAFFGNVWAYFSLESIQSAFYSILAGLLNGVGDVLAIVLFVVIIKRFIVKQSPFTAINHFFTFFILGCVLGPLISAIFGVTGLTVFGFLESKNYLVALLNWWVGDGVGVLLLAPFLSAFLFKPSTAPKYFIIGTLICSLVFLLLSAVAFELVNVNLIFYKALVLALPIAFAVALYCGSRAVYIVQLCVVTVAILATYAGKGAFVQHHYFSPLLELQAFIGVFSLVVFSISLLIEQKRALFVELAEKKSELESLYRHDALTGLWNRYRIEEYLQLELSRIERSNEALTVYMIDVDDFKTINDTYGHIVGDRILVELSQVLIENTRAGDLVGRWGGEEFVIIAAQKSDNKPQELAEKLVMLVGKHDFKLTKPVTISIGFTSYESADSSISIIERADKALYAAKRRGKNCMVYKGS